MTRNAVKVGDVRLSQPILIASGTAGYGAELGSYFSLNEIGGFVTKSIASFPWAGNAAPRLYPTNQSLLNSVGLQGSGCRHFLDNDLPKLVQAQASVIVSIWGHSVDDYLLVSQMLADHRDKLTAVEINLSCPNLGGDHQIFADHPELANKVVKVCHEAKLPLWAKLSPNVSRIVEVSKAVNDAGAQAVTLVNTIGSMAIDTSTGKPVLGNIRGGMSGSGLHPIAVRCVFDVRAALPSLGIIGVGGVSSGLDAAELMLAGADAVQVGTANFADPRASIKILNELIDWADQHKLAQWSQATSASHRGGL